MAYDFNSLIKQADEASNRDKFYTDFEDVDPNVLHQITELTEWMRTKAKGSDVREVIAQLFERTWLEESKEGNANMEVAKARGRFPVLNDRLNNADRERAENARKLAQKANKDEVTNVMTPKGTLAYASLPKSGNQVGWYYYCPDGDGTHGAGNYVWNGTSWFFGGTGDEGYNLLKKDIDNRFKNNLKLVDAVKWEKGSFSETDGTKTHHNERARTSQKIKFSSNHIVCKMADDYGIIIFEYDENESFLREYGVSYGYGSFEINVNRNHYYNFLSRKKNSDTFENLNIEDNVRIFEYATIFKRADDDKFEYKSASSVFEALNKNLVPVYTECVEVGTIDNGIDTANNNRLRTVGYIDIRNFDKIKIKNTSDESLGIQYAMFYNSQKEKIGGEIIEIGETDFNVSKYSYLRLLYGGIGYSTVKLFDTLSVFGYLQKDDSTEIGKTDLNFELFKSTDAIPNEFNDELEKTATAVLADQNENTFSFAFITDLHFDYYLYNTQAPMIDSLYKCVKALSAEANLSFVAFGGDNTNNNWTNSGPSLSIQKQSTRYIRSEMLKNLRVPLLIATGNHDDNSIHCSSANGEPLSKNNQENTGNRLITDVELYCYYAKHNENTKFVFGELGKNYGYLDLNDSKVRVFLLDSEDIPYTKNSNGFYPYTGQWTYAFRNAQLNFIANSLKFQDKDNPAEWKTIFIKHHSINPQYYDDGDSYNFDALLGILNAYQSGGTYKSSKSDGDFSYDVNVDYGGLKGTIIADIAGHLHDDVNGVYSGIPYVVTTTARYTERQDSLPTAMDIFTIDTKKRTVKVRRFGYGTDRSFTF